MLTAGTLVRTDRPGRYLVQLCEHAAAMGRGGGHRPRAHATGTALARGDLRVHAEHTGTHGVITIAPLGKATLDATGDGLAIRVDATDHDALRRIQDVITKDLERFGRRTGITLDWPPPTASGTDLPTPEPAAPAQARARRARRGTIVLAALVVAAVAVHLGLGGAALAGSRWTSVSAGVVLAVAAGKVLLIVLGRRVFHRRSRTGSGTGPV